MYELFILFVVTFVIPVGIGMIQNYYEGSRNRGRASCPPHKWVFQIDNMNTMSDNLVCEKCNYRNTINN
jgi:hypothetical protein